MKKFLAAAAIAVLMMGLSYSCEQSNDEASYEVNIDSPDPNEHQRPGGGE